MAKVLPLETASLRSICWLCRETLSKHSKAKSKSKLPLFSSLVSCHLPSEDPGHFQLNTYAQLDHHQSTERAAPSHDGWNTELRRVFSYGSRTHTTTVRAGSAAKGSLLAGISKEHMDGVSRVLELALDASSKWEVAHTDFLDPPTREAALSALKRMADCSAVVSGGYPQAERCRLSVGRPDVLESSGASEEELGRGYPGAVAALEVSGNFMFDPAAHPDFLGAILNTGVVRSKVGDIVVQGERGAQILVVPELVDFFKGALKTVRTVPVTVEEVPLSDLRVRPPKVDSIKTFEASLRVDAIGSAGFRMSRSKLVDMIESKQVRVNWKEVTKSGSTVKTGDVISIRGKGRVEVGEISKTKKGRFQVELTRFV